MKIVISILFTIVMILIGGNTVQAKSYSIEDMDIQATVNQDGSLAVQQKITYKFKGNYNGIYMNIPYYLEDREQEEIADKSLLEEKQYNGSNVKVNRVALLSNGIEAEFKEVRVAKNGNSFVYTTNKDNGMQQIKIYSPSTDTTKKFVIDYTIENLCVKHKDVGELYYNFIGGAWEVPIKKLNIDIYLLQNQKPIEIWGHGPYNGQSKIINNTHSNFEVQNIKPGQYVAARILFDNSNIPNSQKLSHIEAKELVHQDENAIIENKKEKDAYTEKIIIFAICLFIYWIILMLIFEKDKKYKVANMEEEELFKKYNPMLAGCIQGSRTILARDIIAVILGLINKKIIKLEIRNKVEGKENYSYFITQNKELENQMDDIERYVYNWVFGATETVELTNRLQQMPREEKANQSFKKLNELVEQELAKKGANQAKVPLVVRGFNMFLFALSIVVIVKHIIFNGFNIYNQQTSFQILSALGLYLIPLIPVMMGLLYLPINLIIMIRHKINKTVQRVTGQKVVTTTISLAVFFGVIILLTAILSPVKYIVADEVLICMATILILTDNLMLKNNAIMIEDFSKLNTLKDKIENYSMMEDRDVEQVTLWEQYLSYAVSFGVAEKIMKRIKGLYIDDDLTTLIDNSLFSNFIASDYYMFYTYASLDRRFMKSYGRTTRKMLSGMVKVASSGGGGRILWWRRILWWWW